MKWKGPLVVFAAALAGEWIAENWIIKDGPDDRGFIERSPGFGLDELARAGTVTVLALLGMKLFAGRK